MISGRAWKARIIPRFPFGSPNGPKTNFDPSKAKLRNHTTAWESWSSTQKPCRVRTMSAIRNCSPKPQAIIRGLIALRFFENAKASPRITKIPTSGTRRVIEGLELWLRSSEISNGSWRCPAAEAQTGDFGRAIEAKRDQHFPDAAVDVNLRAVEAVPALHKPLAKFRPSPKRADHREPDLAAVGVPSQHQVHAVRRSTANAEGVMAEQNLGIAERDAIQGGGEVVGMPPQIVHAHDPKRRAVFAHSMVGVAKHADVVGTQSARDFVRVNLEVVIPKHGVNAVARAKLPKCAGHGPNVGG